MPDSSAAKNAAPRMEFVGPDELRGKLSIDYDNPCHRDLFERNTHKVRIGRRAACAQLSKVPSLLVMKTEHLSSSALAAFSKPITVFLAYRNNAAFRIDAFSRSSSPMAATSLEHTTSIPGMRLRTIAATVSSCWISKSMGANTEDTTTACMPWKSSQPHPTCPSSFPYLAVDFVAGGFDLRNVNRSNLTSVNLQAS